MGRQRKTRAPRRKWDLTALARQANHVVAAAVIVWTAAILLGMLLGRWFVPASRWITTHWGATAATILGPLIVDSPTALCLLLVAFPFGRVTVPRPWRSGTALVLTVYGLQALFVYVIGEFRLVWGHWRAFVGRGLFMIGVLWLVTRLMERGRRAALEHDRRGATPEKLNDSEDKTQNDPAGALRSCKEVPSDTVKGGER